MNVLASIDAGINQSLVLPNLAQCNSLINPDRTSTFDSMIRSRPFVNNSRNNNLSLRPIEESEHQES